MPWIGEQDELLGDAPVALGRLAQRLVEVDHHVAEQQRTRRGDAVVIGQVRQLVAVERPLVEREGEDVGRTALAHVVEVQALHLDVAAERQLDLATRRPPTATCTVSHTADSIRARAASEPQRLDRRRSCGPDRSGRGR